MGFLPPSLSLKLNPQPTSAPLSSVLGVETEPNINPDKVGFMWRWGCAEVKKARSVVMWLCRWGCSCGSKCSLEPLVGSTKKNCRFNSSLTMGFTDVRVYEIATRYFVFVTQKHLKLVFVFSNSLPDLVRIEWWNPKTHPNKHLLHGNHLFWVMSIGNRVMSDGNPQIQTTPHCLLLCYQMIGWHRIERICQQ